MTIVKYTLSNTGNVCCVKLSQFFFLMSSFYKYFISYLYLFLPLFKFAGWPFVINSFLFVHFLSLYLIIPLCHVVYCLFLLYSDFCFSLTEKVCKFKLYLIQDSHFCIYSPWLADIFCGHLASHNLTRKIHVYLF